MSIIVSNAACALFGLAEVFFSSCLDCIFFSLSPFFQFNTSLVCKILKPTKVPNTKFYLHFTAALLPMTSLIGGYI